MKPYIIDTTLRDGEQAPGVAFTIDEKLELASLLNDLGIDEIEAGTPAVSFEEQKAIKEISSAGFSFKTSCWCRARIDDLKLAAKLNTDSVNISLPVSDIQIKALGKTKQWVLEELKHALQFATQYFPHITMGAQDATRANQKFLDEYIFFAQEYGARRIRIADTVGIYDPIDVSVLFTQLRKSFPETIFEFHGHNDFGMATANAVAAYKAGAKCISATVNGLGERAGNTVLEELIAYIDFRNESKKYNTSILKYLSQYTSEISGRILPGSKPITGIDAFNHESGIHISAMLTDPKSYQMLNPSDYGINSTIFTFGKHSGAASIINFFKRKGIKVDKEQAQSILKNIEQFVLRNKKAVTGDDLLFIYNSFSKYVKIK